MSKKRAQRTERRAGERALRKLARDREKLAAHLPGGSEGVPMEVPAASVIEGRARSMPCPLCDGQLALGQHRATPDGLRAIEAQCQSCGVQRTLWFRIVATGPN